MLQESKCTKNQNVWTIKIFQKSKFSTKNPKSKCCKIQKLKFSKNQNVQKIKNDKKSKCLNNKKCLKIKMFQESNV